MILVERGPASSHASADPAGPGESAPDVLEFPSARRLGWSLKVQYRDDERSRFRRLPGGWLYVASPTGLECFPDLAAIIDNAHFTGLPAALDALEHMRPAAFVAYDEQTEELQFGRSLDGFASLYFGGELPAIVIGESNFTVARRLGPIRFSKADEEAYCKNWSPGPEGSFLEGVTRCFAGVSYRLRPDREAVERRLMAPDADLVDQDQAVILLRDEMRRICATYGNKRVALRLSGGVDSRVVLAGLMDAVRCGLIRKEQVLCVSLLFPGMECDERKEIQAVVSQSGFEWVGISMSAEIADVAHEESLRAAVPPFPTAFFGPAVTNIVKNYDADMVISGHGGDELFDFDCIDLLNLPIRERLVLEREVISLFDKTGPFGILQVYLRLLLGRYSIQHVRREIRTSRLRPATICSHRLGRRLALARACGREPAVAVAWSRGQLTDMPLLRAHLFSRLSPALSRHHPSGWHYKAVARLYMESCAPGVACVPLRKAMFGDTPSQYLPVRMHNCDGVDTLGQFAYSCYAEWARRASIEWRVPNGY